MVIFHIKIEKLKLYAIGSGASLKTPSGSILKRKTPSFKKVSFAFSPPLKKNRNILMSMKKLNLL